MAVVFSNVDADSVLAAESTANVERPSDESAEQILARVTEILGYDVLASEAEGYVEFAAESIALAESNLAAGVETLPPE